MGRYQTLKLYIFCSIRTNKLKFCGWSYSSNLYLIMGFWGLIKIICKFVTPHFTTLLVMRFLLFPLRWLSSRIGSYNSCKVLNQSERRCFLLDQSGTKPTQLWFWITCFSRAFRRLSVTPVLIAPWYLQLSYKFSLLLYRFLLLC